jgi:hypothetical protein
MTTPQAYIDFHACTALDLNEDGTRLTSTSALKGPDKLLWEKAHGEEIIRLIESQTGRFIHRQAALFTDMRYRWIERLLSTTRN